MFWGGPPFHCVISFFGHNSIQTQPPQKEYLFIVPGSAVGEISLLNFELFEVELDRHRKRAKVNFVLQGIKEGFRLGCDPEIS